MILFLASTLSMYFLTVRPVPAYLLCLLPRYRQKYPHLHTTIRTKPPLQPQPCRKDLALVTSVKATVALQLERSPCLSNRLLPIKVALLMEQRHLPVETALVCTSNRITFTQRRIVRCICSNRTKEEW